MTIKMIPTNLDNLILDADAYKPSHYLQYPADSEYAYTYVEPRGGRFDEALVFGFQSFVKEYLSKPITAKDIAEAEFIIPLMNLPFYKEGWEYILNEHNGYLPLEIKAVPEGLVIPERNIVSDIINTDPKCYWLPGYIETMYLRCVWYMSTVATLSYKCKLMLKAAMERSCDNLDGLSTKLHDFGSRGATSKESSILGALAHLVNFSGTDTINAIPAGARWYGATNPAEMIGASIPAAEHGTITSWGRAGEVDAYKNMLKQFLGKNLAVAVVSDAYDLFNAVENIWGTLLKDDIVNSGGVLVIRPDSGDPATIVCKTLDILGERFGFTVNTKGFRVLPSYIRIIQGDGISYESLQGIIDAILASGWSIDNVSFGMGGGLLQDVNRDDIGWCLKAAAINRSGVWTDVYKDPITGKAKASKRGRMALICEDGIYKTIRLEELGSRENLLRTIYYNGECRTDDHFRVVRARSGTWG